MAEAAKVIRIELRVGGGGNGSSSGTSKTKNKKVNMKAPETGFTMKKQLAAAGIITSASQMLSGMLSVAEVLSYNSIEKENMMMLDIGKKAISASLLAGGVALGGPIGGALALAINEFLVNPISTGVAINIQRNLDQTRATNRFYLTDFAGKGNYTFNYSSGSYINEDLEKVRKGSFYKKGSAI